MARGARRRSKYLFTVFNPLALAPGERKRRDEDDALYASTPAPIRVMSRDELENLPKKVID